MLFSGKCRIVTFGSQKRFLLAKRTKSTKSRKMALSVLSQRRLLSRFHDFSGSHHLSSKPTKLSKVAVKPVGRIFFCPEFQKSHPRRKVKNGQNRYFICEARKPADDAGHPFNGTAVTTGLVFQNALTAGATGYTTGPSGRTGGPGGVISGWVSGN